MLHEGIDDITANGIKVLRKRIGNKIPSSKLDEAITVATWNIREFGKKTRTNIAIHYIAEVLSNFDLIAITELRDNIADLKRVIDILGPYWRIVFSDSIYDDVGNDERIAYLYDKRAVTFTGLAAEADPERTIKNGEYLPDITWWRSPYIASFRAGNFDFVLITAHIRWSDRVSDRIPALEYLAKWIDERVKAKFAIDRDIILMGDFNIPSRRSSAFKAITKFGLSIPNALMGAKGTTLSRKNTYDQILHYTKYTKSIGDKGGVVDFYQNNWRELFPETKFPSMTQDKFTFQLSDHLPLWISIDTWTDDEELDQLLNG
jgi:endonuclease/exonuclease/phosphatase family metal-dependent hydrolase